MREERMNARRPMGLLPSTFHVPPSLRALVWKEWRQLRGVYLLLILLGTLAAVVGQEWSTFYAAGTAFLVLAVGCPIVLSAAAFAGERESDTQRFLLGLPVSVTRVVLVKFGTVVFLSLASTALALRFCLKLQRFTYDVPATEKAAVCLVVAAFCLLLPSLALLVSSLGAAVMATVLGALGLGAVAVGWLAICNFFLSQCTQSGAWPLAWVLVTAAFLTCASLLHGIRTAMGERPAPFRAAKLALAYALLCAAPSAVVYCRVVAGAEPADHFARRGHHPDLTRSFLGRRHVALQCRQYGWSAGRRVAFVDSSTGQWTWADRLRSRSVHDPFDLGPWSPDGTKCLLEPGWQWLWPVGSANPGPVFTRSLGPGGWWKLRIVDCLREGAQDAWVPGQCGWFDDSTLFSNSTGGVLFLDARTGEQLGRCTAPEVRTHDQRDGPVGITAGGSWALSVAPGRAVFTYALEENSEAGTRGPLLVRRHTPDLPEAEVLAVPGDWGDLSALRVSPDGGWLLFRHTRRDEPRKLALVALSDGTVLEPQPPGWNHVGPGPRTWPQFVGEHLVFAGTGCLRAYDLRTGAWGDLIETGSAPGDTVFSPSGRYALVRPRRQANDGWEAIDVLAGQRWPVWPAEAMSTAPAWMTDDMILIHKPEGLWTVRRDGSGRRKLLP